MPAINKLWFIGDEFGYKSFETHFLKRTMTGSYIKENFDVTGFMNGKYISNNPSMMSRLKNALATAINEQAILPRLIVVVPDDDLIKLFHGFKEGLSKAMGKIIDNIMTSHERSLTVYKDYLDDKSKTNELPHVLWIQPPMHENFANNFERNKFGSCLERMASFHANVSAFQLKKIWNGADSNLYVRESRRYTTRGLDDYWEAIDKTVKYCDTITLKPTNKKKTPKTVRADRFHWQKNSANKNKGAYRHHVNESDRRRLPTPPAHRENEA